MADRDALIYIYEMTQGHCAGWLTETNWQTEIRLNRWHGIKVDEGAHVTDIVLGSNRMSGELLETDRLKGLVNLRAIYLNSNFLYGTIPSSLGDLTVLQELNLAWNKFTGLIPDSIYTLFNLKVLRLDNNEIEGTISEDLGKLRRLRLLNFSNNKLSGAVPKIGNFLMELRTCDLLPGNDFDDVADVPKTAHEMKEWRAAIGSDSKRATLRSGGAASRPGSRRVSGKQKPRRQTEL